MRGRTVSTGSGEERIWLIVSRIFSFASERCIGSAPRSWMADVLSISAPAPISAWSVSSGEEKLGRTVRRSSSKRSASSPS